MFYLCTGFHRSGTSLLAQTLRANGINMGIDLMGATYSNPLGHVEDMPMVRLHDKVYKLNDADWRYHDSSPLIKPVWLPNYIRNYLNNREEADPSLIRGGKDPRAVHFLKEWQVAGRGNIKYIFIYRHWSEACFSLLNRHSRHFLNTAHPMCKSLVNLSFWQQPTLAFDMWHSANRRILDFYKVHSKHAILISQEEFVALSAAAKETESAENAEAKRQFTSLAQKIDLEAQHFDAKTLSPELITKTLPEYATNGISQSLISKLDELFDELNAIADLANSQLPHKASSPSPQSISENFAAENSSKQENKAIKNIFADAGFDFSHLAWPEFSGALLRLPMTRLAPKPFYSALTCDIDFAKQQGANNAHRPMAAAELVPQVSREVAEYYYSLAKVAHYKGVWLVCYVFQMRAMLCDSASRGYDLWDIPTWNKFVHQDDWLSLHDELVQGDNPFRLQPISSIPEYYTERVNSLENIAALSIDDFLQTKAPASNELSQPENMHIWLLRNVPYSSADALPKDQVRQVEAYTKIAKAFEGQIEIEEFCYVKALRAAYASMLACLSPDAQQKGEQALVLSKDAKSPVANMIPMCLAQLMRFYVRNDMLAYAEATSKFLQKYDVDEACTPICTAAIQDLIEGHHFSHAERFKSILDKFFGERIKQNLNKRLQTEKDALRPAKGLKHRFALLPHSLPYEDILKAGDKDPAKGQMLDLLNRRLSFLAKDNELWLKEGCESLNSATANTLESLVNKHWAKLWPQWVWEYLANDAFTVGLETISSQESLRPTRAGDDRQAMHKGPNLHMLVEVECIDALKAFVSLFKMQASNVGMSCFLVGEQEVLEAQLTKVLAEASLKSDVVIVNPENKDEAYKSCMQKHLPRDTSAQIVDGLAGDVDGVSNGKRAEHFIGTAQCKKYKTHLERNKQLACWYSLLGFEQGAVNMIAKVQQEKGDVEMIVPHYHPSILHDIQDKPLFYPVMGMFWVAIASPVEVHEDALVCFCANSANKDERRLKLLLKSKQTNLGITDAGIDAYVG